MDIKLIDISKSFGDKPVLEKLNMTFEKKRMSCIMGPSGSGKTTLINILMGLINADQGEIEGMEGLELSVVFQEDRLIEHWDAIKNVKLVCDKWVTKELIEKHFEQVGLMDYEGKPVSQLSGGMRRRVAIIRSILSGGNLLIMDEPFKGLDDALKLQVIQYVREHSKDKTLLVITHDVKEVTLLGAKLLTL